MPEGLPGRISVRSVEWRDFAELTDTYWRLYEERDRGAPIGITLFAERPTQADEVEWFSRVVRRVLSGDLVFVVAEVDGHVVGSCSVGRLAPSRSAEHGHVGELGILVAESFRGKGVGTALLERALADARRLFEVIFLSVFTVNEGAQRLYRRFGFVPCGHLPRMVKRGGRYFDEERMVLVSPPPEPATGENR